MHKNIVPSFILIFWAGFVCSISFMEAWLKFKAPGVTLPLGLGIGKLVFTALNRVEWALLFTYILSRLWGSKRGPVTFRSVHLFTILVITFLLLQTFWLLPELTQRTEIILAGNTPPASPVHILFIVIEAAKVVSLTLAAFYGMRKH